MKTTDSGTPAVFILAGVVGPARGQVQTPVDEGVTFRGGVGEHRQHLAVLDLPVGSAVLGRHSDRFAALFDGLGVVGDEHSVRGPQVLDHVVADLGSQRVRVPFGAVEQPFEPVGVLVPDMIGELPGVLAGHLGHKPANQIGKSGPRLRPGE
nr:hypothetical protein [Acrocarpospora corrugata]